MNRSHSTIYRICLLAVVILTIAGGIFYYVNYVENQTTVTEGTLVKAEEWTAEKDSEAETAAQELVIEGFRPFGKPLKCA